MFAQQVHRAGFGAAHFTFFGGLKVVVAGEVEPAVDEVEREFGGESGEEFLWERTRGGNVFRGRLTEGGVDGDADLAGETGSGVAFERDDVGDRRVVEEFGVELREGGVGEEDEGEFAGGATAAEVGGVGVEDGDGAFDRAAVEAEPRVAVGDGDRAGFHGAAIAWRKGRSGNRETTARGAIAAAERQALA